MTAQPTRDQLRALTDAATPGPWVAGEPRGWGDNDDEPQSDIDTPAGVLTWDDHGGEVFKPADAEFIAAARTAVPHLLDQLDRAEHRIARLEAQTDIRGRAVVMYRERARDAEARIRDLAQEVLDERGAALDQMEQVQIRDARIKAVQDVLDQAEASINRHPAYTFSGQRMDPIVNGADIRRALDT